jgi:hypothetical protein
MTGLSLSGATDVLMSYLLRALAGGCKGAEVTKAESAPDFMIFDNWPPAGAVAQLLLHFSP